MNHDIFLHKVNPPRILWDESRSLGYCGFMDTVEDTYSPFAVYYSSGRNQFLSICFASTFGLRHVPDNACRITFRIVLQKCELHTGSFPPSSDAVAHSNVNLKNKELNRMKCGRTTLNIFTGWVPHWDMPPCPPNMPLEATAWKPPCWKKHLSMATVRIHGISVRNLMTTALIVITSTSVRNRPSKLECPMAGEHQPSCMDFPLRLPGDVAKKHVLEMMCTPLHVDIGAPTHCQKNTSQPVQPLLWPFRWMYRGTWPQGGFHSPVKKQLKSWKQAKYGPLPFAFMNFALVIHFASKGFFDDVALTMTQA
ncbi:uncharacterized protein LACBIDRAFT_333583 [Laccaria bicolor S238N-H82]|uniref:Predicted protein n=1 Tax=Laccaria bicolor (strain S238N-H82 / ATCC MYA-4686) TaxID=486041 RepID=B0DWE1_LACBS|nr:uncharacterized protein LACBIDRAFT_333583 [Laccaria bicolor S238N-H82]EDR01073.1 predicted protein [Laccaria bicolor S238N-H82]|eukprot:XP_001888292.1 predicted protein [Laccaria bicolor S238N-H82]